MLRVRVLLVLALWLGALSDPAGMKAEWAEVRSWAECYFAVSHWVAVEEHLLAVEEVFSWVDEVVPLVEAFLQVPLMDHGPEVSVGELAFCVQEQCPLFGWIPKTFCFSILPNSSRYPAEISWGVRAVGWKGRTPG